MGFLAVCDMPVRGDINNPPGRAWQHFLRDAAADIRRIIPPASKLLIVPVWNSNPFGVAVRHNLPPLRVPRRANFCGLLWGGGRFAKAGTPGGRGGGD